MTRPSSTPISSLTFNSIICLQHPQDVYNITLRPQASSKVSITSPQQERMRVPTIYQIWIMPSAFELKMASVVSNIAKWHRMCSRLRYLVTNQLFVYILFKNDSLLLTGDVSSLTELNVQNVKYSDTECLKDYVLIPGGSETGLNQGRCPMSSFHLGINVSCLFTFFWKKISQISIQIYISEKISAVCLQFGATGHGPRV